MDQASLAMTDDYYLNDTLYGEVTLLLVYSYVSFNTHLVKSQNIYIDCICV